MRLGFTLLAFCSALAAQSKPSTVYRLDITLREAEDQNTTDRTYMFLVEANGWGRIRAGSKYPFYTTGKEGGQQMQAADIGTNLECRAQEAADSAIRLSCGIEISSVAPTQPRSQPGMLPVLLQRKTSVDTIIPLGRETEISSLDESPGKRRLAVRVTAQRM